ncbi:MAG: peptide-methionine (S)-S-oxide reductase MsrA [Prevotella sp.]|nr:peptide-methionine (S)-S-oxide reductase MsrA [Prevotella sp.]MCI6369504.1 peptide-methionine (S)-S-oxide reductase MsrA [Prevotella sp.]MCI6447399.1 peptide-methionine (S)-S-oxide reductase MsrA [Prevotella sp.]MCI6805584.1 peptide-methionine (S)-S-oxide reductase MsrA [Prevotella sp.]MCI7453000.1 peptide-methionine (S)-S-oxide reductase MsrA [Prevotella sp.]
MNPIDIALRIATAAHAGQLDRDGYPAILHPLTVGLMGHTDEEKMAGFLHDVVEDTSVTFDNLIEEGIPIGVVNAIRLLTHGKESDYYDYIQGIIESGNPIALQVKYNDLKHNFERGKAHPDLQQKHGKALEMVKAAIEECSKVDIYHAPSDKNIEVGIFACGCFWGTQHHFQKQKGVQKTLAGYTGGEEAFPTYADVRDHKTHHVEAIIVEYNPEEVSYESLCKLFFEIHDPAQTDGVGPDIGSQYRSCIFYRDENQKETAERVIQILRDKGDEVNTLLLPEEPFYIGEAYHQNYYEKTGGEPYCHMRTRKF